MGSQPSYLLATKCTFVRRTISEDKAGVNGILHEISRSSSVFKVVPDLGRVRRREQRVEVRILSSPTKVIRWCDIYMLMSHLMA